MAQTGYTPIQLYYSSTTTNAPTAGNLASGELAINITDGKLFYKDNGGVVQVIAWKTTPTTAGGTGLTSWTAGDLPYYATGTTLSKLGIGTNGQILTSTGTAPQWSTLSGVAVTTFSAGTTGFTPSSATSGAVTLAGTLATTNGGTGLTSFTANGVVYASSSSALTTGSALVFDGTNLGVGAPSPQAKVHALGSGSGAAEIRVQNTSSSTDSRSLFRTYSNASTFGGSLFMTGTSDSAYPTSALCLYNFDNLPLVFGVNNTEGARLTSTGLGIGTSSPAYKLDVRGTGSQTVAVRTQTSGDPIVYLEAGGANAGFVQYSRSIQALQFSGQNPTVHATLDSSGNLGIGTSSPVGTLDVVSPSSSLGMNLRGRSADDIGTLSFYTNNGATNMAQIQMRPSDNEFRFLVGGARSLTYYTNGSERMRLDSSGNLGIGTSSPSSFSGYTTVSVNNATNGGIYNILVNGTETARLQAYSGIFNVAAKGAATNLTFETNGSERARITSAGFTRPVAYADTVSALGNTGTATTIDLQTANVFTATLTGNCTFTLSNPIATGSSSFTLILTNDGTAGRTVAWAGGSFVFPGGAAALSRTTTANAVDVWVFFTPNGGTTWYGNIAMKDMKA